MGRPVQYTPLLSLCQSTDYTATSFRSIIYFQQQIPLSNDFPQSIWHRELFPFGIVWILPLLLSKCWCFTDLYNRCDQATVECWIPGVIRDRGDSGLMRESGVGHASTKRSVWFTAEDNVEYSAQGKDTNRHFLFLCSPDNTALRIAHAASRQSVCGI